MKTADVRSSSWRNYLDLCPSADQLGPDGEFCIPLDWSRSHDLRTSYGDFTIVVELLNQFAVRAVRQCFCAEMRHGQRFIPASIRELRGDGLERTHRLVAHPVKTGEFYRVSIRGEETDGGDTGFGGLIYVARVDEDRSC